MLPWSFFAVHLLSTVSPPNQAPVPIPGDIVYLGLVDQTWQVFACDIGSRTCRQLTHDPGDKRFPAWFPDGSISFHTSDQRAYRIDSLGGAPTPLFSAKWPVREVLRAASGSAVAFTRARTDGADQSNLWVAEGLDSEPRLLTRDQGIQCQASWAPDGRRLVYMSSTAWNDSDLRIIGIEGEQSRRLTNDRACKFTPAWSPDGSRIAFSSAVSGDYEIWAVDPDGSHLQRLTDCPGNDTRPCWAPDSRSIVFSSLRSGVWELWQVDSVGGSARRLETIPGPCRDASWRVTPAPAMPAALSQSTAGNSPSAEIVKLVSVQPKTLRFSSKTSVRVAFELLARATVRIDFVDEHGTVVATRDMGKRDPGRIEALWDGLDSAARPVPDGVYRYAIVTRDDSGRTEVYDPSTQFGGTEVHAPEFSFDKPTGLLKWSMPQAGLVRLRAALDPTPHLRTMLDWVPMEPGEQSYPWDGMDASGLVRIKDHPRCLVTLTLLTVAPNTIFVAESTSPCVGASARAVQYLPTYERPGQSPFANIPPERRHDPRFTLEFVGAQQPADAPARIRSRIPVRVTLAPEDAAYFQAHQFEAAFFVDLQLLFEEEEAGNPFTFVWDTSQLDPGEHLFTVVLYGYLGQTGVMTRKVIVEK